MKILAIDTALGACSAAVLDGSTVLAHRLDVMERGHAEALAPMVAAVMQDAAISFRDLDRLAVTTGPGTFTGQRVGMAFARGLRVALKRPLLGITTLQAMAMSALDQSGAPVAAVLHDARRNEVYAGIYTREETLLAPALLPFVDAMECVHQHAKPGGIALAGTAAPAATKQLCGIEVPTITTEITYPDALWVARLALRAPEPMAVPQPLYLRPPDARLPTPPR